MNIILIILIIEITCGVVGDGVPPNKEESKVDAGRSGLAPARYRRAPKAPPASQGGLKTQNGHSLPAPPPPPAHQPTPATRIQPTSTHPPPSSTSTQATTTPFTTSTTIPEDYDISTTEYVSESSTEKAMSTTATPSSTSATPLLTPNPTPTESSTWTTTALIITSILACGVGFVLTLITIFLKDRFQCCIAGSKDGGKEAQHPSCFNFNINLFIKNYENPHSGQVATSLPQPVVVNASAQQVANTQAPIIQEDQAFFTPPTEPRRNIQQVSVHNTHGNSPTE